MNLESRNRGESEGFEFKQCGGSFSRTRIIALSLLATAFLDTLFAAQPEGIASVTLLEKREPRVESEPLFRELDPANTGMAAFSNAYGSPRIWGDQWRTYLFGAIGTGIAIGDIDNDGLPDVFAVSKNEESRLYRNLGDFRFEDITREAGLLELESAGMDKNDTPAGGVSFADVNNDGHLDIYLCYLGAKNQLWINDGTGHFTEAAEEWGVDAKTASVMGYFADYDRDGLLDLYVATNLLQLGDDYPGPKPDLLFRNTGDRFEDVTATSGISGDGHAHSAIWWDYDGDGFLDIYVANDFAEADRLYRNNGDGTFSNVISKASPRAPYYAMGADFGDLNGDGLYDLWVADMAPTERSRYKRTLESHNHVYAGVAAEFPNQYMQNVLLLNLDGHRFTDVAAMAGLHRTDWTWAVRLVDMDNDGYLDGFATNGMLRSFNDGDLGLRLKGRNNLLRYAQVFKPTPVLNETNLAYKGFGNLRFQEIGKKWGLNKLGVSFGAAFGDLDRDGTLDLVLSNMREPPSVFEGLGGNGNAIEIEFQGSTSNYFGIGVEVTLNAGGLRQTKTLIPQRGYMSTDEPMLHFGLGPATIVDEIEVKWPSGIVQKFDELTANQRYVLHETGEAREATLSRVTSFKRVEASFPPEAEITSSANDEYVRQSLLPFARTKFQGTAVSGDFNGDRRADLVLGGSSGNPTTVLLGGDNLKFRAEWSLDLDEDFPSGDVGFALGDFNGDDNLDLVAVSGGSSLEAGDLGYQDRLYLGNGEGGFARDFDAAFSTAVSSSGAVATADFDGDGSLDLFLGGSTVPGRFPEGEESSMWRGLSNGNFERVGASVAPELDRVGRVTAATWADFSGDGFPDLIVMREWGTPLFFRNENGKLTLDGDVLGDANLSGLWTSVAVGDFDADGRLDFVAGNLGLNTGGLWRPDAGLRRLWWKAKEEGIQIIESFLEDGIEWPLPWRDRLLEAYPKHPISEKSYTEYAEHPFPVLFGNLEADGFEALELTETRSGVFWQRDDGTFDFEPLPAFTQSGRLIRLLVEDFDNDGCSDIVASIEPPSPVPWTGRTEWGNLAYIKGSSDRLLECELPLHSGFDTDARSPRDLLWDDFDGDGEFELLIILDSGKPEVYHFVPNK